MKRLSILVAVVLSVLVADGVGATGLPSVKPEQVGLSSERLDRIRQTLRADVEKGRIPGAVVVVARKGRVAYVATVGFRDKATNAPMETLVSSARPCRACQRDRLGHAMLAQLRAAAIKVMHKGG